MNDDDREVWQNTTRGKVIVQKFGPRGAIQQEVVRPGQKVSLTHEERVHNQEIVASASLDVFSNGILSVVKIADSAHDYESVANNPNVLSDSELRELFNLHPQTFAKRLKEIDNRQTLKRLAALAEESDASLSKSNAIAARLNETSTHPVTEVTTVGRS